MDSIRQNKVSRLIQRELSGMFQNECKEIIAGAMVSVTTVRVSPDLSYAKIYLSIFPSDRIEVTMNSLEEKNKIDSFCIGEKGRKADADYSRIAFFCGR